MWRNAHDTYLEERVLSADPVELIELLHQAAITAVGDARRHLAEGRILARAKSISKACEILLELAGSLDHQRGGDFSVRLSQLYAYMHRRLVEANSRQSDQPWPKSRVCWRPSWRLERGQRGVPPDSTQGNSLDADRLPEPELAHASGSWSF